MRKLAGEGQLPKVRRLGSLAAVGPRVYLLHLAVHLAVTAVTKQVVSGHGHASRARIVLVHPEVGGLHGLVVGVAAAVASAAAAAVAAAAAPAAAAATSAILPMACFSVLRPAFQIAVLKRWVMLLPAFSSDVLKRWVLLLMLVPAFLSDVLKGLVLLPTFSSDILKGWVLLLPACLSDVLL